MKNLDLLVESMYFIFILQRIIFYVPMDRVGTLYKSEGREYYNLLQGVWQLRKCGLTEAAMESKGKKKASRDGEWEFQLRNYS